MRRPRMQALREMRPIGSVKDREQQPTATPAKSAGPIKVNREKPSARPIVASSTYVAPTVKKVKKSEASMPSMRAPLAMISAG